MYEEVFRERITPGVAALFAGSRSRSDDSVEVRETPESTLELLCEGCISYHALILVLVANRSKSTKRRTGHLYESSIALKEAKKSEMILFAL